VYLYSFNACFFMAARPLTLPAADFGDAVWRADELGSATGTTVATGHAALDAQLPGGGWPVGSISEILQTHSGLHEWRLILPALRQAERGPVLLVGPPHVPFGPGLGGQGFDAQRLLCVKTSLANDRLWAAEQALRCADVAAVLAWLPQARADQLRRLQIAAAAHNKLLFVMRPAQAQGESSPAVLRLLISSPTGADNASDALHVQVLKRRGPPLAQVLQLPARPARLATLLAVSGARGPRAQGVQPGGRDALDCLADAA
jgi:protein ImuA